MKKNVLFLLILFSFSSLYAEKNKDIYSENQAVENPSAKEDDSLEFSENTVTLTEDSSPNFTIKEKITEIPITFGFSLMWGGDLNLFGLILFFYPPISATIVNYDSTFNGGSVYELAYDNAFTKSDFFKFGMHVKLNLDIYYKSFGFGGGCTTGFFMAFSDMVYLKAGGHAGLYKTVPFAGPEASFTVLTRDSIKFDCTYCYGFTADHKRLWKASLVVGMYYHKL